MTRSKTVIPLSLLALMFTGCFSLEVDIEQLSKRISSDELQFDAAAALAGGGKVQESRRFDVDLGDSILEGIDFAEITGIRLIPVGIPSLDFVNHLGASLDVGSEPVEVARYNKAEHGVNADGSITLRVNRDFDHTQYLQSVVPVILDLDFDAPDTSWGIEVELNIDVGLSYQP